MQAPSFEFPEAHARLEAEWRSKGKEVRLDEIRDSFATHGRVGICIGGKLWRFEAAQPGRLQASEYGTSDGLPWIDHAIVGIDVPDVVAALS